MEVLLMKPDSKGNVYSSYANWGVYNNDVGAFGFVCYKTTVALVPGDTIPIITTIQNGFSFLGGVAQAMSVTGTTVFDSGGGGDTIHAPATSITEEMYIFGSPVNKPQLVIISSCLQNNTVSSFTGGSFTNLESSTITADGNTWKIDLWEEVLTTLPISSFSITTNFSASTPQAVVNFAGFGDDPAGPPIAVGQTVTVGGDNCAQIKVTAYNASTGVYSGTVIGELANTIPNDPNGATFPISKGNWSVATPQTTITGLNHLVGKQVWALADGVVEGPFTVASGGTITLSAPASNVVVGLSYLPKLQDLPITTGEQNATEGKRKQQMAVTIRTECASGLTIGPDFNTQTPVPGLLPQAPYTPPTALISSDLRTIIQTEWDTYGQVCIEQPYPLPATVLGIYKEINIGDNES